MDKQENLINNFNHCLNLYDRKSFVVSGVKKIENFDNTQFLLETVMGYLNVKGENLELIKLDTLQGTVSIKGLINGVFYVDENIERKDNSFFNKLFK